MRVRIIGVAGLALLSTLGFQTLVNAEVRRPVSVPIEECMLAFGGERSVEALLELPEEKLGRVMYIMTKAFGDGTLDSITANLDNAKQLGVERILSSPMHPQTVESQPNWTDNPDGSRTIHPDTPNNHRYWPLNHYSVGKDIGGNAAYKRLKQEAARRNINIGIDVVNGHFGPADEVTMKFRGGGQTFRKTMSPDEEPDFFWSNRADSPHKYDHLRMDQLYRALESEKDKDKIEAIVYELNHRKWNEGLNSLNSNNPINRTYLQGSYGGFVRAGNNFQRLDAFKHISINAQIAYANAMARLSAEKNKKRMVFLAEFLVTYNYYAINAMAKRFEREVPYANTYFIDFPHAYTLRRINDDPDPRKRFGLVDYANFLRYREDPANGFLLRKLAGDVENHDFLEIITDKFQRKMFYALTEFISMTPTILFHGGESLERVEDKRAHIDSIDPNGLVGVMLNKMDQVLRKPKDDMTYERTSFLWEDDDHLVMSKTVESNTYVLIVSRTDGSFSPSIYLSDLINPNQAIETIIYESESEFSATNPKTFEITESVGHELSFKTAGKTVVLLKVPILSSKP